MENVRTEKKETGIWIYFKRSAFLSLVITFVMGLFEFFSGNNPFTERLLITFINSLTIIMCVSIFFMFLNKINVMKSGGKSFFKRKRGM